MTEITAILEELVEQLLVGAVLVPDAMLQCNQLLMQHVSHRALSRPRQAELGKQAGDTQQPTPSKSTNTAGDPPQSQPFLDISPFYK